MSAGVFEPLKILEVLANHEVSFVVIGGVASTIHGAPFLTIDLDAVPEIQTTNLDQLASALSELSATLRDSDEPAGIRLHLDGRTLKKALPDFRFLRFNTTYGFLALLYKPAGTEGFRDLVRSATKEEMGSIQVLVASLEDVIRSKQAVGRPRDLEQLPTLRRLLAVRQTRR
ncbi:MAG: hypothetical protein ACR2L3_03730 [Actinomycetota bacterium]